MKKIYKNHFICAACNQEFHQITSNEQMLGEHEERKKTLKDYDDGSDLVIICDNCFNGLMNNHEPK